MLRAEAQWKREVNKMLDEVTLWAVAWKHVWTRIALKLVTWMQDTVASQARQKKKLWGEGTSHMGP